ncbi:hypothetical protein M899_3130 [Bacteriovorax sp. BSW11_IV]|uniref:hypothetical protein n=1 Tax=Bacteriovorax sp. BSW11_IV TaxID=1353529 RepID=UPI00038A463E|nr:hypothetical protein [Bacteriovorax sp. BSW11_IV]EQC49524.1 hypothetical protein M899_3130 [Bacteriovorax sp. BSW11_IV]
MLEDLKDKLSNSLEKMKQLLPEKFRGKPSEDEEYEEDGEEYEEYDDAEDSEEGANVSEEKTAQHDISQLEEDGDDIADELESDEESDDEDEEDEEGEEDEESDEEKAKKKKQLLIRVGAGLVIGFLLLDTFVLNAPEETPEVAAPVVRKNPKKRTKPKAEEPVSEEVVAPKEEVAEVPKVEERPVEEIKIPEPEVVQENKEVVEENPFVETPQNEVSEMSANENNTDSTEQVEEQLNLSETEPATAVGAENNSGDKISDTSQENTEGSGLESKLSEITEELENKEKEILDFTPAPNYEEYGKGLVYNCKDKHWACVDRKPYLQCEMNYKWSKQNGKAPDCAIEKTYADFKSCRIVQVHYINTVQPAPDCN